MQGVLSIVFAGLVLVVVAVAAWVAVRAVKAGGLPTTEEPDTPSRIFAPKSFLPTTAEKEVFEEWKASGKMPVSVGTHHHE